MSGTTVVGVIEKSADYRWILFSVLQFLPLAVAIGFCGLCLWLIIREAVKHKEVLQKDRVVDCLKRFGKRLWSFKWYILFSLLYIAGDVMQLADAPMRNNLIFKINNSWQYANQAVFIATMQQALCIEVLILLLGFCNMKNHPRIAKFLFLLPWIWWAAGVIREGSGDLVIQFLISVGIVLLWQGWCLIWQRVKRKVLFLVCVIVCSFGLGFLWLIMNATCCDISTGSLSNPIIYYYDAKGRLEKTIFRSLEQFEEYTRIYNESGEIDTEITRGVRGDYYSRGFYALEEQKDPWKNKHPLIITQYQYTYDENGRKKYADAYVCAEGECKFKKRTETFYDEQGREIPEKTDIDYGKKTYDKYGNLQKETFDGELVGVHYWINPKWKQNVRKDMNNQPINDGSFKSGKKDGFWKEYYRNGKLKEEGNYIVGAKDGFWKAYYDNGNLASEGTYKDGKPDGLWKEYYYDGELKSEKNYKNGQKDGVFKTYGSKGHPLEDGQYKDDKQDGLWKYYDSSTDLKEEGYYKNGQKEGVWKSYYEKGKPHAEYNYKDGKPDGIWKFYEYETGKVYEEVEYKEGVQIRRKMK